MRKYYSIKCIFVYEPEDSEYLYRYEERITLWHTKDMDEAIKLAEEEATQYAKKSNGEYIKYCVSHKLDEKYGEGKSVYSTKRNSDLEPEQYLDNFYDTGDECLISDDPIGELENCLDYEQTLLKALEMNKRKIKKLKTEI